MLDVGTCYKLDLLNTGMCVCVCVGGGGGGGCSTISDHTPYNFPHGNGDPQRVFQRQNDSKTLARLSKRIGRCRRRIYQREGANSEARIYSQLR